MSKKKNKFKKNKSHKPAFQQFNHSVQNTASSISSGAEPLNSDARVSTEPATELSKTTSGQTVSVEDETRNDPRYIAMRQDVKKILVTFACLGLILVGAYFLDRKTTVLNNFGNWIYRISNIQVL